MPPGQSHEVPTPISAEIASAQNALGALVALRDGSVPASARGGGGCDFAAAARRARGSGGGPSSAAPSPRGAPKQRPDATWLALEERVAAQVASLQQKHDAEQLDAERVLRASVTRLESRVRALEGQGVRADRRAAELAGLAQALTEEQRALLIRLDRMEEHLRGSRQRDRDPQPPNEECLRRLHRLEREHRANALNLRLIVSLTEEAQQRQNQRLKSVEELVDGRLRPIEERLHLVAPEAHRAALCEELRTPALAHSLAACHGFGSATARGLPDGGGGGSASASGGSARVELGYGDRRAGHGLEAAQQLLRRCDAGSGGYPGDALGVVGGLGDCRGHRPREPVAASYAGTTEEALESLEQLRLRLDTDGVQELRSRLQELGSSLCPRTDAVEARVRALADAMEEVRTRLDSIAAHTQVLASHSGEPRAAPLELSQLARRELESVARRSEAQEAIIAELRSRVDRLVTHDQVAAACREMQSSTAARVEELRCCLEKLASSHGGCSDSVAKSVGMHAAALEQLRRDVDTLVAYEGQQRRHGRLLEMDVPGEAVAKLGRTVEEHSGTIGELRAQVQALMRDVADSHASSITEMREQLRTLVRQPDASESHAAAIAELRAELRAQLQAPDSHTVALAELREQLRSMSSSPPGAPAAAVEAQAALVGELTTQVQGLLREDHGTQVAELREQVRSLESRQDHGRQDHRMQVAELREQVRLLEARQDHGAQVAELREQVRLLEARQDHGTQVAELREQVRLLQARQPGPAENHGAAISELRQQLLVLSQQPALVEGHALAIAELREQLVQLQRTAPGVDPQALALVEVQAELREHLEQLRRQAPGADTQAAALAELQEQHRGLARQLAAAEGHAAAITELREHLQALSRGLAFTDHATVIADHAVAISDLRAQLQLREGEQSAALAELRSQLRIQTPRTSQEAPDSSLESRVEAKVEARMQDLRCRLDEVALASKDLRIRVEDAGFAGKVEGMLSRMASSEEAIAELRAKLLELPAQEQILSVLRAPQAKQAEALEELRVRLDEVRQTSCTAQEALRKSVQAQSEELLELQGRLASSARPLPVPGHGAGGLEAAAAEGQEGSLAGQEVADLTLSALELEVPRQPELEAELRDLRGRCDTLQEAVDQKVMLSVWRVEKQLPEAMEKVERLLGDYPDRIAKVEENDVRLGLALARLGAHEHKVQSCMERVERLPNLEQIRKLCREELWKRLEETDVQSLSRSVDLQARAIEEIGERLQEVCDVVCYGGEPPVEELAARQELASQKAVSLRPTAVVSALGAGSLGRGDVREAA